MPTSSREFQKAALQRLTAAEFLLDHGYNLDAMYPAGYTFECALKALILERTTPADRSATLLKISSGASMHNYGTLNGILKGIGGSIPIGLNKKLRRSNWSTALRYESGRTDASETRAFLKTAKAAYDWVQGQLP